MLQPGSAAPEFDLPGVLSAQSDDERYRLSEDLSTKPALLNFYMFDFHPACTENMCDLHDLAWFELDTDIGVFGISTDSVFSHREFAKREGLEYPLLTDSDGTVADAYGVLYDEFRGHKRIAKRAVFLVDSTQAVRYSWCADDPSRQPDWAEIKAAIEDVKSD